MSQENTIQYNLAHDEDRTATITVYINPSVKRYFRQSLPGMGATSMSDAVNKLIMRELRSRSVMPQ